MVSVCAIPSGDVVKTESSRKVRYSTDLQISGRYLNTNLSAAWQKQKEDDITTVDVTVQRLVNSKIVKDAAISTKFTKRTQEVSGFFVPDGLAVWLM